MEGWDIIQKCELAPLTGVYDKDEFLKAISGLSQEEFNRFCRAYLHLSFFHANNQSVWVTDDTSIVLQHPSLFWKIEPVNFDAPVNFRRVR
jgi:hypothetical protein